MGTAIVATAVCICAGYLLGSLNFSIILSKTFKGEDIRNYGSKNAGMTNILRTYGKKYAVMCGAGDFSKGLLAVLLGRLLFHALGIHPFDVGYAAGAAAMVGHLFPLYFGFRGGKGVMTGLGVIIALDPIAFAVVLALVLPLLFATRIVSLASVTGAALYPVVTLIVRLVLRRPVLADTAFALIFGCLVLYMHRANIKRLVSGTEYRFGGKKKEEGEQR